MKSTAIWILFWSAVGLVIANSNDALAITIFKDNFNAGTAGTNVGSPWQKNDFTPVTYQSAASPFPGGSPYADWNDPSAVILMRLMSSNGSDDTLTPSINGHVSTYSFDFYDVGDSPSVTGTGLIFGYYRQQDTAVDLNGSGRSYSGFLHNGFINPGGSLIAGTPFFSYTPRTVNTVFLIANDSASTVTNYAGSGHDLLPSTADVWLAAGAAAPSYVFSVSKQNTTPPNNTAVSGVGFRTFSGDEEHFNIDNVLLQSGATFDRSAVPEPASVVLLSMAVAAIGMMARPGRCATLAQAVAVAHPDEAE